jgi:putative ABC transport system permease protein
MFSFFIKYNIRSLLERKVTNIVTLLGISFVIAVYVTLTSLSNGIDSVFLISGNDLQYLIVRQASLSELQSSVSREQAQIISTHSSVQKDIDERPIISHELVVILNTPKKDGGAANVTLRGVGEKGFLLRPKWNLVSGRLFIPGMQEIVVSRSIASRYKNMEVGDELSFGSFRWKVVGHFEAGSSAADSEIWTDNEGVMQIFERENYSSLLVRLKSKEEEKIFQQFLENDARIVLEARDEITYYKDQTKSAAPIRLLTKIVGIIMGIGAIFGIMNTLFSAISARTREIGTLRALGFSRPMIIFSFISESCLIAITGSLIGFILGALLLKMSINGVTGTTNISTFSEVVFEFSLTVSLWLKSLCFGLFIGIMGSVIPAYKAANIQLINALRS